MNKESMEQIEIREATPEDAEGIAYVQRDAWFATYPNKEHGITIQDIEDRYANMSAKIEKWEKSIRENKYKGDSLLQVASEGGNVLGWCVVTRDKERNELSGIYVHPDHHGKGIGNRLADKGLKWLGDEKDISVLVADYNEKAIKFYEKLGFVDTGERILEERLKLKSGNTIPERRMIKRAS
jgi:ribosomal protein S18 acetylase RimI-like enzyme